MAGDPDALVRFRVANVQHLSQLALRRTPETNSTWDQDAQEIVIKDYVNLGVAASTDRGLVVPNTKSADTLSLPELALAISALADAARAGKSTTGDLTSGTTRSRSSVPSVSTAVLPFSIQARPRSSLSGRPVACLGSSSATAGNGSNPTGSPSYRCALTAACSMESKAANCSPTPRHCCPTRAWPCSDIGPPQKPSSDSS